MMVQSGGATNLSTSRSAAALAAAWWTAIRPAAAPAHSHALLQEELPRLAVIALDAVTNGAPEPATRRGRLIGEGLAAAQLLHPEVLERTLICLSDELAGVAGPELLARLLAGVAGGYYDAAESSRPATHSAGERFESPPGQPFADEAAWRDSLAATHAELSAQIAERIRAEEAQRDYAERLQRLHTIDLAILSAESLAAIVEISLSFIERLIPSIATNIALIDPVTRRSIILSSTNPAIYPAGRTLPITMLEALESMGEGQDIFISDLAELPEPSPNIVEIIAIGGRSLLTAPLHHRNELIGGLTLILPEVRRFTDSELSVVHEIAGSIAVAIQNRRLLEAEQAGREREAILREVAASLTLGLGQDELLSRVLAQLNRVVPCRSSAIMLLEDGELASTVQQGNRISDDEVERMLLERPRSIWRVLETGRPYIINDTYQSPDWFQSRGHAYIRAWLGVPLLVKGECLGLLTIDRDEPNTFTEQDKDLALTFANQAAIAIDNMRLFNRQQAYAGELEQAVRERTRELEVLYGIAAAAVRNPELDSLLARALELTVAAFDCVAAAVHLIEGEEGGLQPAYIYERRPEAGAGLRRLLRPLQMGAPTIIGGDELPADWPGREGLKVAVVPLRRRERNLGALSLVCDTGDHLAGEGLPLLTTIADQLAVAVENTRLRQVTRQSAIIEERERLSRDIHDAITQAIYGISLFAEAAAGYAAAGKMDKVRQSIQSIQQASDQALRELRLLLYELRTERLARKGLVGALRERFQTVEQRAEIAGGVHAPPLNGLPVPLEETFYRVALEALNNALRHSRAKHVDVSLAIENGQLLMSIVDDGVGFDPATAIHAGGIGLESMYKRIGKVGGQLELLSRPGEGTRVVARAPLPADNGSQR